ncbi:tail fiber domain-containing protein, partial [Chitinophaga sp.]|uniref:tail fiber domain-containing protein n=1 Tax=Chitinophaga sp. TaxID=1869181 RepID=UPI002CF5860D
SSVYAQVGIHTTTPKSSLDVSGKTDTLGNLLSTDITGLQAPRLTRSQLTDKGDTLYGADQTGAMIYITDISGGDVLAQRVNITAVGYYYFDGNVWQKISMGNNVAATNWSLAGNTGTTAGTNFIGTADATDFVTKSNGIEASRVIWDADNNATHLAVGTTTAATVSSPTSGSTADKKLAKLTIGNGDASINSVTVGLGGGQIATNTVVGALALSNTTTGSLNTAIGNNVLPANTSGARNTAVGQASMRDNTTGSWNTAIGANSLISNTTGTRNIALGYGALSNLPVSASNIGIGFAAGQYDTPMTGGSNIIIGRGGSTPLTIITSGSSNIAIGHTTGYNIGAGDNNIVLGNDAAVGVVNGSNQIQMGNYNVTSARVQVAWTITSDKRWKENITRIPYGLDFVKELKPVAYHRINDKENPNKEMGFVAQEVEELIQKFGWKDQGFLTKDTNGYLAIRYNDFIPLLVRAVQEQDAKIESQNTKIAELEALVKSLAAKIK